MKQNEATKALKLLVVNAAGSASMLTASIASIAMKHPLMGVLALMASVDFGSNALHHYKRVNGYLPNDAQQANQPQPVVG